MSKGLMNNRMAVLFGPFGKICQVELKINGPDNFLSGGWSQFLALHGITETHCLLLRYEGNMAFTVKVFGPDGCQIKSKHNGVRMQQSKEKISKFIVCFNLFAVDLNVSYIYTKVHLSFCVIKYQQYSIWKISRSYPLLPFRSVRGRKINYVAKNERNEKPP